MEIRYIQNSDIDRRKWDSCVHYANNGNVFGYRWFLNNISKDWDGLVEGDYTSVMPLFRQKTQFLKRNFLYTPDLIRHAGLYSTSVLSTHRLHLFLKAIPAKYKTINLRLNEQNYLPEAPPGFQCCEKQNYQLMLHADYTTLSANYSPALKEKIQQAKKMQFIPSANIRPEKIAAFIREFGPKRKNQEACFHASQRIMYNVLHRGIGFASALLDADKKIVATAFLIYSHSRILNLISAATPEGKRNGALALLYDLIVQTHAGRPLLLDFNTGEKWPEGFGGEASVFVEIWR